MLKKMMFRRKKLKRPKTPPSLSNIFILTMVIFGLIVYLTIVMIDRGIEPTLMSIAERRTEEFATRGINTAVRFASNYNYDDVLNKTYDDEGNLVSYNWDSAVISEINQVATDRVEEYFRYMNTGEPPDYKNSMFEPEEFEDTTENLPFKDPTVVEIPLGQVTGNTILANLGPKIPINLEFVGNVRTNIIRDEEQLGINGAWVSLYVEVEADVQIVIPFMTDVSTVKSEIFIDSGAVMFDIPDFYGGGNGENPSISVPKDSITEDKKEDKKEDKNEDN